MARFGSLARSRELVCALSLSSAIAAVACGGPATCITGTSQACTCTDSRTGAQVCRADGTFDVCVCASAPDASQPDAFVLETPDAFVVGPDGNSVGDAPPPSDSSVAPCALGTVCECTGGALGYCESVAGATRCVCDPGPVPCAEDVDWLFLVDTSNSMVEEQAGLVSELPRLVRILASGDADGDGMVDFAPVRSMHLGVVTPDLGAGERPGIPTCDVGWADDGILRRTPTTTLGCPFSDFPSGIFEFASSGSVTPDDFAADFACVAQAGTGGCGFEQQLEAPLRALSPSRPTAWTRSGYAPVTFRDGSHGHGIDANDGFVRPASVLALTLVTDEDDCSVPDTALFDPREPRFSSVGLNLRCPLFEETDVYPTSRYVDGLLGLRAHPGLLVYSAIAGVPTGTFASYDALLADPAMANVVDPAVGDRLLPVCTSASGNAFPARRIVSVARDLERAGVQTSVSSICSSSFESAVSDVVRALIAARGSC